MPTEKVKASQLRSLDKKALSDKLNSFKEELAGLRIGKVTVMQSKVARIKMMRKSVARVLTVMHQNQKTETLKMLRAKKVPIKRYPLNLRRNKTRAICKRLTKHEQNLITRKEHRKNSIYPMRKFALSAVPKNGVPKKKISVKHCAAKTARKLQLSAKAAQLKKYLAPPKDYVISQKKKKAVVKKRHADKAVLKRKETGAKITLLKETFA